MNLDNQMNWYYFENPDFRGIFVPITNTNGGYEARKYIYEGIADGIITIRSKGSATFLPSWNIRPATEAEVGYYLLFIIDAS